MPMSTIVIIPTEQTNKNRGLTRTAVGAVSGVTAFLLVTTVAVSVVIMIYKHKKALQNLLMTRLS